MNVHLISSLSVRPLNVRARACLVLSLCAGLDSRALARAVGVGPTNISAVVISPLLASGCIGRWNKGKHVYYTCLKAGRRLVRDEQAKVLAESLAVLEGLKGSGRARLEDVAILERAIRGE